MKQTLWKSHKAFITKWSTYKQLVENAFCEQQEEKIIVGCSLDLSDGGSSDVRAFDSAVVFLRSGIHIFPLFPLKCSYGHTI